MRGWTSLRLYPSIGSIVSISSICIVCSMEEDYNGIIFDLHESGFGLFVSNNFC